MICKPNVLPTRAIVVISAIKSTSSDSLENRFNSVNSSTVSENVLKIAEENEIMALF